MMSVSLGVPVLLELCGETLSRNTHTNKIKHVNKSADKSPVIQIAASAVLR